MSLHPPRTESLAIVWFADGILTDNRMRPTEHFGQNFAPTLELSWECGSLLRTALPDHESHRHHAEVALARFASALLHRPIPAHRPSPPAADAAPEDFAKYFGQCFAAGHMIDPDVAARLIPPPPPGHVQALAAFFTRPCL